MKQIKAIMIMAVCLVLFTACPGKHNDPDTFERSLELSAESGSKTYTANDLKAEIKSVTAPASWLTATAQAYSGGSPKVTLAYTENTGGERQAVVTITDTGDNKVFLTVKQLKPGEKPETKPDQDQEQGYGIDDTHDTVTDQPAYSRQQ